MLDPTSLAGTINDRVYASGHTAPEILKGIGRPSKESDVFAFGMVMIEVGGSRPTPSQITSPIDKGPLIKVFTGAAPFSGLNIPTIIFNIMDGQRPKRPTHPSFTDCLWKLVQECWKQESRDRPQMDQVVQQLSVFSPIG